jgi:uncharacterized protein YfaS (alpha-2-macroglobulin family)
MLKPHSHVLEQVDAYLHDVLPVQDAEQVRAHCESCPICRVALEEARTRQQMFAALPPVEASEALIQTTLAQVEHYRAPRITWRRVVVLAYVAAVLVVGLWHLYVVTRTASPYDLRVLGQSQLYAGSEASLRVLLVNPHNGRPLSGVPVQIALGDGHGRSVELARLTTDAWGTARPRFRLPDWSDGPYELRVEAQPSGTPEIIRRPVRLVRSWRLMLTTDKPVYQPGQTIHVRSLALSRPELRPAAGQTVVYTIADPRGNVIFRRQDVTSRFGIAAIDCPLADEITEGDYRIECRVGDTTSAVSVEVRRYVLPKFRVEVQLDQPYYQPGQKGRVTVQVDYFFGKPVAGAEVQVRVEGVDLGPVTYEQRTVRTDAQGRAELAFRLPDRLVGRPQQSGQAQVRVVATVRDPAGQEQQRSTTRTVAAEPIRVEVIPESGRLVRGQLNTVYLLASYPDGRPAQTRLAVSGVERELSTSRLGVAAIDVRPSEEQLTWTIRATDAEGRSGRREVTLRCGQPAVDFIFRTDRAVYQAGQTMQIVVLGGGREPVFLDLFKDGQTVLTEVIPVDGGRGHFQFDLPADLCGTLDLCAYRYAAQGLPVRKSRAIYVRAADDLRLRTELDRQAYRPGAQAKLRFTLTDNRGRPAPGALSLSAVDEAVFAVLPERPGLERAFFTLEQELLRPIYAIYDWSPDDASSAAAPAERVEFEQALFSRTAQREVQREEELREMIQKHGNDAQYLLRIRDRPDWEELAAQRNLPSELLSLLRGEAQNVMLSARTYPTKEDRAADVRRLALERVVGTWIVLGLVALLIFPVVFFAWRGLEYVAVIFIILILLALLVPAVNSAREASPRALALSTLESLEYTFKKKKEKAEPAQAAVETMPAAPRLREWFPETLLWRPELITDEQGRASLTLDLADSITTWRLAASAVSAEGKLGAAQTEIRVFQPFFVDVNLPVSLTRGDEVTVPVVVYNYRDQAQTVELVLADVPWFVRLGDARQRIALAPNEVRAVSYRIRVTRVGRQQFQVSARAGDVADAVRRAVDVVPDGRPIEQVQSGSLATPAEVSWSVPPDTIEGSVRATVKIYPSNFSQLVEGLDAIFQRPYGCFEQTSSTTYPNVLALAYLRAAKKSVPAVEAKARQYIHLGYQRLLGFEIAGGGFDWFGRAPANAVLTAYGLMEFTDMAQVYDVDPRLLERTRRWLLDQQRGDGSWALDAHRLHDDPTRGDRASLSTTAYIAWAVFAGRAHDPACASALDYLLAHRPDTIEDPYTLALVCNALWAMTPGNGATAAYVDQLEGLKRTSADRKLTWWEPAGERRTMFYGHGVSGRVEATAAATLALLSTGRHSQTVRSALAWLVSQKDPQGTWHSTQATVLALKALLAGTHAPLGGEQARQIDIQLDGRPARSLRIPADQAEVVQQVDLTAETQAGQHRLTIIDRTGTAANYQTTLRYAVPGPAKVERGAPLEIRVDYDKTQLRVNDTARATVALVNHMPRPAPMVIVDLPIPAGFAAVPDDFVSLATAGQIAKYQLTPRTVVVYLRGLAPNQRLEFSYRLRALTPVKITVPGARAYEYYNPERQAFTPAVAMTVAER